MKILNNMKEKQSMQNKLAFHGGTYSLIMIAILLATLIVINIFASVLPSNLTKFDMSSTKLYSITSNTKAVVNAIKEDVNIYWIVQAGEEDEVIENLLNKYSSLSDHIKVEKKNPDVHPTFASQYTSGPVENNSLVVECGSKNRFIAVSDIYIEESDMQSYSTNASFDGEGAITSAIDYVTADVLPQLYILEGHGEAELTNLFSDQITKENIETQSFSLLDSKTVPEDASCVLIHSPKSDISPDEKTILEDYVKNGGKLMVIAGPPQNDPLVNLTGLLTDYGMEAINGVVVEEDADYYALSYPYLLMPDMAGDTITAPLLEEKYRAILPISQGFKKTSETTEGTVTEFLTTSDTAFSKQAGYGLTTYEKEDGDIDGPFAVGVSVETNKNGQLIWFASSAFLDEQFNAFSSGANLDLVINALSSMLGEREAMAIKSKSLNFDYLTISNEQASQLKFYMIWFFPILYLGIGIYVIVKKRRERNATK